MLVITVPNYIRKFKTSNSVRPKYWVWNGKDIRDWNKAQTKGKALLKKYIDPVQHFEFSKGKEVYPICLKEQYTIAAKIGNDFFVFPDFMVKHNTRQKINQLRSYLLQHSKHSLKKTEKAVFVLFNKETQKPVLVNESKVGKPNYKVINSQSLYSGTVQTFERAKMMQQIKESFVPYLKDIKPVGIEEFPLKATVVIYDTVRNSLGRTKNNDYGVAWDVGNRGYCYMKGFLDLITTGSTTGDDNKVIQPLLPDDDRLHVTVEAYKFIPLPTNDDSGRKLVFILEKDTTTKTINNQFYKNYHNNGV